MANENGKRLLNHIKTENGTVSVYEHVGDNTKLTYKFHQCIGVDLSSEKVSKVLSDNVLRCCQCNEELSVEAIAMATTEELKSALLCSKCRT